ncbi:C40 family peptidase [Dactylosporangium sp. NPDC000521]|uniref:C40 family peptidase n=1 Tax=Dactylosporangium sp. NPDC000521 TaxID=3363975 RepID=UPI0036BB4F57
MNLVLNLVRVPVATLWAAPEKTRPCDAAALRDEPDIAAWVAAMTPDEQTSSDVVTQALLGDRVTVEESRPDGWSRVAVPGQHDYPGWIRTAHLTTAPASDDRAPAPAAVPPTGDEVLAAARSLLGVTYVWGGLSPHGLDCSGLVHLVWRRLGVRLPRDAHQQQAATTPVLPGEERPGDLYFFARPGRPAHHVGIVVTPGTVIHASPGRHGVVEEPMPPERAETLAGAHRV